MTGPQTAQQLLRAVEDAHGLTAIPPPREPEMSERLIPGGQFLLDGPDDDEPVWGRPGEMLWAAGEALILAGGQGLGKTTIAGQIALARAGIRPELLGYPVTPGRRKVLYLAMDRPKQIRRSMRRMVTEAQRGTLDERLVVWPGPPPADLARHTELLRDLAQSADADTVIVDSLKDAAVGLVDDEVGAAYNRARQTALAAGIEVLELHHLIKRGADTLADVYGSVWLTSGVGSVLVLAGEPGDPIVELRHLKQPADEIGPLRLVHDHTLGRTDVWHATDLLAVVKGTRGGLTAKTAAAAMFTTDKPSAAQIEKARRRLDRLVDSGHLDRIDPATPSDPTGYRVADLQLGDMP